MGLALAVGCATSAEDEETLTSEEMLWLSNELVLDWNNAVFAAATELDGHQHVLYHSRALAMVHIALHDAINAVLPVYRQYAFEERRPGASVLAAGAQAAHDVIEAVYGPSDANDALLDRWLAKAGPQWLTKSGVAVGKRAAAAIVERRANDGSDGWGSYMPGDQPGDYQLVPPFNFAFAIDWRHVTPFALNTPDQFRSAPPQALTSARYAEEFNEVKAYGARDSTVRSADQTNYAFWWYEAAEIGWNRVARVTLQAKRRQLFESARLMALLNIVLADSYIAGWDGKVHYDFWRPYTAIRAADTDGNSATDVDAQWEPLFFTPPIQDHPSTHSALGAAAAAVMAAIYRRDDVAFSMSSTTAPPGAEVRSFSSLSEAAAENADSRVMVGVHFRSACDEGLLLGSRIAAWTLANHLRPRWWR